MHIATFPQAPVCGISRLEGSDAYDPASGAAQLTADAITNKP